MTSPRLLCNRRQSLALMGGMAGGLAVPWSAAHAQPGNPLQPRALSFPRDHGAHTDTRTEWWYLTGHVQDAGGRAYGFQVTFFRSRVDTAQSIKSRLAAKHLLFAHAALTDVQAVRHWQSDRLARWNGEPHPLPTSRAAVFAATDDTHVVLRDWHLRRDADGHYSTRIQTPDFELTLGARPTQALVLQGEQGFSRKGPDAELASFYVSQPQLAVAGRIKVSGKDMAVRGTAWLDHEWSEAILHPDAVGWDWIGMNLFDGSSLTAFRLRREDGTSLWAGGSFRLAADAQRTDGGQRFSPDQVVFAPKRLWKSTATQTTYPVEWAVQTPAGSYTIKAVMNSQELDSRQSTGTVYWEGLSDLFDANARHVGRGYLEMTGYAGRLVL